MRILLVEPGYYTKYPPLGLLKIAAYHKLQGDQVRLVRGNHLPGLFDSSSFYPDRIYVTSLFTYAWREVHSAISFYRRQYPRAEITVGGIYASLCPDHIRDSFPDISVHQGVLHEVEDLLPDYSLVPDWDTSLIFSSRGCIRKCPFCEVRQIEPAPGYRKSIRHLIYQRHKKIILWDNNILASPYREDIFTEIEESGLIVDFNQGLDARLLTEAVTLRLKRLRLPMVRLAYDSLSVRDQLQKAVNLLKQVGFRGGQILIYCLYNNLFDRNDTPETFLHRVQDILSWGAVCYPMRFEPLEPVQKGTFVSPQWDPVALEMIADFRRVMGKGGALAARDGIKRKILGVGDFYTAFDLNDKQLLNTGYRGEILVEYAP
jgi:hypothetical protein